MIFILIGFEIEDKIVRLKKYFETQKIKMILLIENQVLQAKRSS